MVIVLNNLQEDEQFEGIHYLLVSINGIKKSIKWYSKSMPPIQTDTKASIAVLPFKMQLAETSRSSNRTYPSVALVKFLLNCRRLFEPNKTTDNDDNMSRLNTKLMQLKSSQVSDILHKMFHGISNSTMCIQRLHKESNEMLLPICDKLNNLAAAKNVPVCDSNLHDEEESDDNNDPHLEDSSADQLTLSVTNISELAVKTKKVRLKRAPQKHDAELEAAGKPLPRVKRKKLTFNCFQCTKRLVRSCLRSCFEKVYKS